jgi:hypothetical protein
VDPMSAQPAEPEFPYPVVRGEAAIVPLDELRRLRAIERHASAEVIAEAEAEEAEIAGVWAEYRQWAAGGFPGAMSLEELERSLGIGQ